MPRKKIVAGNWKMNKTYEEGLALVSALKNASRPESVWMIVTPPALLTREVSSMLKEQNQLSVAAQNCHQETSGAYTGEISAPMLRAAGAELVIIGHSERRQYFGEDNALLLSKVRQALAHDLQPIFCMGEPLEIREAGTHLEYVKNQLEKSVFQLAESDFKKIILAYEPIWAIGTGKTAQPEQAQEMHQAIRSWIVEKYNTETANDTSILYGGSCKPANAKDLFSLPDVDGGLIGGASLKADDFLAIAHSF